MKKESARRLPQLLQHDRDFLDQGIRSLAGVDEAGRGPLAGPVVASAVIVRDFSFSSEIDDSKKLTSARREAAYTEILAKCRVGVSVVEADQVDRLNIFQATMLAMRQALERLGEAPDCALIDGPHAPMGAGGVRMVPVVDGDAKSFSIACASIVAKVTRDRLMREYHGAFPQYGFDSHKGYGTGAHLKALKEHGPCRIHRHSFGPVKVAYESWKRS